MQPSKLLILDLDETLVHASESRLATAEYFTVDEYFVYIRPQLEVFLKNMAQHFALAIWSSGGDAYVNSVVANIKPQGLSFMFV